MNATGTFGYAPPAGFPALGAFVTHPVSLSPRSPAQTRGMLSFPGGFLLHSGYPNPGLKIVLRRYASRWKRLNIPLIVHILPRDEAEVRAMVLLLENIEGVTAIEIGPPVQADGELVARLVQAGRGELPVIVCLAFERAPELAERAIRAGAAAVSLGPARGALPGEKGELISGRLYGQALFPQALGMVQRLAGAGLPVVGAGGVYHPSQVEAMLAAGAIAVQLDSALWRGWKE